MWFQQDWWHISTCVFSGSASPSKDMEKIIFPTIKSVTISFFFTWKPNQLGLENCSKPNFCETGFRYFWSLFTGTWMNLSPIQQSYFCTKNQNYLLKKVDLRFFLSCRLRITIKITICHVFQVVIVKNCAKNTDPFNKNFFLRKNGTS